ncbi:MAG TPA: trypsin-like peptidase domain-containing protein [Acetobacteraceae bacterium]|nr:trypsin-like peptidase domain-containing protein [Acetobacteraceae bacterium]
MHLLPLLLCATLLAAASAHAAKPPPLGANELPTPPAPSGKPPPLGSPEVPRPGPSRGGGRPVASGSGFVVAPGRVLTNNHVVAQCSRVVARNSELKTADARVLATDARRDLAVLSVPDGFAPPLTFRANPPVTRGDTVVVYGFPLSGLLSAGPTLTTGNVNALSGFHDDPLEFQISAPVQPGNSGGPLLDGQGHVIGVVVAKLNAARVAELTGGDIPQNVNFAVKGSEALAFLRERNVEPATTSGGGAVEKSAAEIGRIADPSTLFLRCYR